MSGFILYSYVGGNEVGEAKLHPGVQGVEAGKELRQVVAVGLEELAVPSFGRVEHPISAKGLEDLFCVDLKVVRCGVNELKRKLVGISFHR
jgi:hypothetical protein